MVTELKPYPAYKDSGMPWLGQVPERWEVQRAKRILRCIDVRSLGGDEELLTVSSARGVIPRSTAVVTMFKAESYKGYKLCWPGDLVINSLWAWARGLGVSRYHGIISSAYSVYRPRAGYEAYSSFIHALVRSTPFQWELQVRSKGIWISRLQLTDESFLNAPIPIPPPTDQAAIVRYLDHADRKVQHAIRARQQLIKLLTEQKQAIIQRAVTRGLDPNVRLKPSGVSWLGDMPEHWTVVRLRHLLACPLTNGLFKKKDSYGSGVPLVNVTDIYQDDFTIVSSTLDLVAASADEVRTFRVQPGDILFVRSSLKLEGTGQSALVSKCDESTVFECHLVRARPNQLRVSSRFLTLFLNSPSARSCLVAHANTVTMSTLPQGAMKSISVPVPPLCEQEAILAAVDRDTASVMKAIDAARGEIDLLREYRTCLITDVVTGKLDVRDAAAYLPDEPEEQPEPLDEEPVAETSDLDAEESDGDHSEDESKDA